MISRRAVISLRRIAQLGSFLALFDDRTCLGRCVWLRSKEGVCCLRSVPKTHSFPCNCCQDSEALNRARERGIVAQRAMNSRRVVISGVGIKHSVQVGLA